MITQLLGDKREIRSIWWEPTGEYSVGHAAVTKIEVYPEAGQFCNTPWFAIWKGDIIIERINAATIAGISYREGKK